MRILKNISFYLLISSFLNILSQYINSNFLTEYLSKNIIGLLITLLAINTASLGLVASKIQDILEKEPRINFKETISEMKFSLYEQIFLISLCIISQIILNSEKLVFTYQQFTLDTILLAILIYSIIILWDTGKAVFVIIDQIENLKKTNSKD